MPCRSRRHNERRLESANAAASAIIANFMFLPRVAPRGSMSEWVAKLREIVGAPVGPHGLVTLLWALVV
jgi:hypothetical protein